MKSGRFLAAVAGVLALALLLAAAPIAGTSKTISLAPEPRDGCTAFSLDNHGSAIFGKNKDSNFVDGYLFVNKRNVVKSGLQPGTTGQYAVWRSRYGSVTFNHAGYQFASEGMNEAGLMISTHALPGTENPAPDERPPIVSAYWAQYVLDNFSTVAEVLASDAEVRISDTWDQYLVCDRTGACAAIAFLGGKMVSQTGDALPVKVMTNDPYEEALAAWQGTAPEEMDEHADHSLRRFAIVAERVTGFAPASAAAAVDYAFDTLALADQGALGGSTITTWSLVFDTENRRVHFRTYGNPAIRTIDFAGLDFSCGAPVQMLDLHAGLSGDVTGQLPLYAHRANLEHMFNNLEAHDVDLPPVLVSLMVRGTERFPCLAEGQALPYPADGRSLLPPFVLWLGLAVLKDLAPVWAALVLGSLAFLAWDLARSRPVSWGGCVVCGLLVVLLGPLGLLGYLLARRKWRRAPQPAASGS